MLCAGLNPWRHSDLSHVPYREWHTPAFLFWPQREHSFPSTYICLREIHNRYSTPYAFLKFLEVWMPNVSQPVPAATFLDWTSDRKIASFGTNAGATTLPFQNWRSFKEAFAPELIAHAVHESPISVKRCIDPFGGSGTTGLACQFLGIHPVLVEINPFLVDLITAKLCHYESIEKVTHGLQSLANVSNDDIPWTLQEAFAGAPRTLIEPGYNDRWIFSKQVAERIMAIRYATESLDKDVRRLFRVLLGGVLIDVSNVRVSGKGRRYRQNWAQRHMPPTRVDKLFTTLARSAIDDIRQFSRRAVTSYDVLRGDSRRSLSGMEPCELAVFSPPYPNSSDYTDIYNVELWALGYLTDSKANRELRSATLSSHVQIIRDFREPPEGSSLLMDVLASLDHHKERLWDHRIPAMVGAYFRDLLDVLDDLATVLVAGGLAWIVVGDSQYVGVQIPTASILEELVPSRGWTVQELESCRSIRTSPQQGGEQMLNEQLLVLRNNH